MPGLAFNLIGSQVAGALGPTAVKTFKTADKVLNAPANIAQAANTAKNIKYNYQNASQENQYHRKLAAESENNDKEKNGKFKQTAKTVGKVLPPAIVGALALSYGGHALKTKSATQPFKDFAHGAVRSTVNSNKLVREGLRGAKRAIKSAKQVNDKQNVIIINKPKQTPFTSFMNGAMAASGALGVHMLGDAYFSNKRNKKIKDSYESTKPGFIKAYKVSKKVRDAIMEEKENKDREKQASIDWGDVVEDSIKGTAATAIPIYLAKDLIANKFVKGAERNLGKAMAKKVTAFEDKRIAKKKQKEDESGVVKTASIKGDKLMALKTRAQQYVDKYGTNIAKQGARALTTAVVTAPLIIGTEYLNQRSKDKAWRKKQEEREKRKDTYNKPYRNYNRNMTHTEEGELRGRDFKGGQREKNS